MSNTKIWAISLLIIAGGIILFVAAPALSPFIIAAVLAYCLDPFKNLLINRLKMKKWLAITLSILLLLIICILIFVLILPPLITQATKFVEGFEGYSQSVSDIANKFYAFLETKNVPDYLISGIETAFAGIFSYITDFLKSMLTFIITSVTKIVDIILILVSTCYFLADGEKIVNAIINRTPFKIRENVRNAIEGGDKITKGYLKAQVIISAIEAGVIGIIFAIMGVKYNEIIIFLTFALNFIPFFGSIVAGVFAALITLLTGGLNQAIIAVIIFIAAQQLLSNILAPRLQAKESGLHPLTVLISLLVCNRLWGPLGMFLSVPIAGVVKLVFKDAIKLIRELE